MGGGRQSVHDRHLHIHQYQVEAGLCQLVQGLCPLNRQGDLVADRVEHGADHLAIGGIVIHQQDAIALLCHGFGGEADDGGGRHPGRPAVGEGAATALLALDRDIPPHQAGEVAGDLEAQPGAAILPRDGDIGLGEALEQILYLVAAHADPRVLDSDADGMAILVQSLAVHPDSDGTLVGELDGIVQQVEQDLAYPQGVHHQPFRRVRGQGQGELDPFCAAVVLHQGPDVFQQLGQMAGHQLQLDATLLQF